jgi:hypothetical protein
MAINELDEARGVLREAADRNLSFSGARRLSYYVAFVQGDTKTMERELEASIGVRQTNSAFGWLAHTSASEGRVKVAHEQYRRGIQMSLQGNFNEVAAQLSLEDAELHATVGQCADATREVSEGLKLGRDYATLERAARALALCGVGDEADILSKELSRRFPEATFTIHVSLPVIAAASALERGEPSRAHQVLESVRPYDRAPSAEFWIRYLRGQAELRLKNGPAATTEFRAIVDHQGEVPGSVLYPLAHLGLARAGVLMRDTEMARKLYERFLTLWQHGDPDLQSLKEAREEYARLQ